MKLPCCGYDVRVAAPFTSVVIVNWNGAAFLPQLLKSIQLENVAQIIVVDNHSTDDSLRILEQFPGMEIIANDRNTGYGAAANQGIRAAKGPYILMLNADLVALPESISILEKHLNDHPQAAIAAPQLLNPDGTLQPSIRAFPSPASLAMYLSFLDRLFPSGYRLRESQHRLRRSIDQPMGAALMARRDVLEALGGFDPQFFLYMEEVDLCYRVKQKGYEIHYVPEAKMIHHAGGSSKQDWERSQRNFLDSSVLYFKKHDPRSNSYRWMLPAALLIRSFVLLFSGRFTQSSFYLREAVVRASLWCGRLAR